MSYYVYIIKNSQQQLYIGQTCNLQGRVNRHNLKDGRKHTSNYIGNFKIVYYEVYATREAAMRRELQLKKWSRTKKEALVSKDIKKLNKLSKKNK